MPIDFERLLVTGVERGASDFHLKAGAPPILRIHGRLIPQGDFGVITADDMDGLARRMLAERWYNQLRDGKEIDSAYSIPNFGRFRVNMRSEEHTSELQSRQYLVCRLLLEKKN